jgi:hypothetical protein
MKLEFSKHIFEKYSNIKFHENPSSGSRVVPSEQRDVTRLGEELADHQFVSGWAKVLETLL